MLHRQAPDLIGTTVEDRFEILSLVGEGGMANVYKAKHKKNDQFVAIKVLKRHQLFSQADIERLKREGKALKALVHPNIVKAHSFGFLPTGEPYLVLDFLNGKSMEDYVTSGDLPPIDWTLEVLTQVCRGLSCAHRSGLIHRDLKPSNVMIIDSVKERSRLDWVKLLDFGTAKSMVSSPNELVLTQKGIIFGSPFYISPEQISGSTFDERTDIYSFGCLMYESLTGKLPYNGSTQMDTLMMHLHEVPPPFSSIRGCRNISMDIEAIVIKCMDKEPNKRFRLATEVEQALQKCLHNLKNSS